MFRAKRFIALLLAIFVYLLLSQRQAEPGGEPSLPLASPRWPRTRSGSTGNDSGEETIANATLGFERVFVINLPTRTDRRDTMSLAAALTGIDLSYSDGIDGAAVPDRVLPPLRGSGSRARAKISKGNKGSWRAHINVLRTIVEQNLSTALILEDDTDWDVRLKTQLQSFSRASRAYLQPIIERGSGKGQSLFSLNSFPSSASSASSSSSTTTTSMAENPDPDDPGIAIPISEAPRTKQPLTNPYGDGWDVLWLGHCGTDLPAPHPHRHNNHNHHDHSHPHPHHQQHPSSSSSSHATRRHPSSSSSSSSSSSLRILLPNDPTVPLPKHLRPHPFALPDQGLTKLHPPHTRVVHAASGTICTQAYAVSQRGARKLLWRLGVERLTDGFDLMLRDWCDDVDSNNYYDDEEDEEGGEERDENAEGGGDRGDSPVCLTVQPPLFSHFYPASTTTTTAVDQNDRRKGSDITSQGGGYLRPGTARSQYIRLSVRLNFGRLVKEGGEYAVEDLVDQWPDGE